MPTAKGKGGSTSYRYRPASEYDDATLAQKREYWRTKKREQRARLSERRGKPTQVSHRKKFVCTKTSAVENNGLSNPFTAASCPSLSNNESYKTANNSPASQSGTVLGDGSVEDTKSQKERWQDRENLSKALPQLPPSSCSVSVKAAGGEEPTVKCLTRGVSKAITSTQLNTSASVPPVRVDGIINGSSAKTEPQPCVSMQRTSVAKTQHTAQVAFRIQPRILPTNVNAGIILTPSSGPALKTEGKAANISPQGGTKSALVTSQIAKSVGSTQPCPDSEEEKAAKRREHWRIKKREQRAKMATRLAKAREKMHATEMSLQRQTAQKTGEADGAISRHPSSQPFLRGIGQKQCSLRVKSSYTSAKRKNDKLQIGSAGVAQVDLTEQVHVKNSNGKSMTQAVYPVKKPGEAQRKLPSNVHLSNVSRGIARCKTPRQKFIEAQKNFMNQRNMRFKTPMLPLVFGNRNFPKIDPTDTPEQIIAKRREYWRVKKREQRAKLSFEVKARLKEKDSLMRRVKRYQKILEELRNARALAQSAGNTHTHASETIGGFIKEDGTVTISVPQVSAYVNTVANKNEKELNGLSNSPTMISHQPDTKRRSSAPPCANQPAPSLYPSPVKVSIPLSGRLVSKPSKLVSVKSGSQLESRSAPNARLSGQLTLSHPPASQMAGSAAGPNQGGCVMKMAISNSVPSVPSGDPELTEEERMAKKREYWRIKKREQRAARAHRLRQGLQQARATAAFQRRKAQKQAAATMEPLGRSLTNDTQNATTTDNSISIKPHASEIKQESESVPTVDLNSQPEQAICPDMKPPTSPTPPSTPQTEPDSALNGDCQATTLLAVASMKKLLEESLSRVTEYNSEPGDVKIESVVGDSESEIKPNYSQPSFERDDEVVPIAADLTLEIKSWQPDTEVSMQGSTSPNPKDTLISVTLSSPSSSSKVVPPSLCDHSSQTPSNFIVSPTEPTVGPVSSHKKQRLCCSPEPPKLHHLPMDQHCEPQCQGVQQCRNSSLPSPQTYCSTVTEQSGLTSLQKKREYWKLMKRQQRARLRARQTERRGECSSWLPQKHTQASNLTVSHTVKGVNLRAKSATQPKPCIASLTAVVSTPTVLVVSPTTCSPEQSPDKLHSKLPIASVSCLPRSEQKRSNTGPSQSDCLSVQEVRQKEDVPHPQLWMSTSTDNSPSLPALKPPDNPLSTINLQPIEPPGQTPDSTLSHIKIPCTQIQSPVNMARSPTRPAPISTMVPPKPISGESEEDFLRRRREYWRIKKKEQRAKKAMKDKVLVQKRASTNWRPILPAQDIPTQDSGQWVTSEEGSDDLISTAVDTDVDSFPYSSCRAAIEGEPELLFADYENNESEEVSVSDAVWRNRYLMDYDPLNQLLVCMVCGDLQYSHSLEGVRGHIDEAHPDTLTMDPREKQQILEAWDEQVSQREQFFISQLQQHSEALAEAHNRGRVN